MLKDFFWDVVNKSVPAGLVITVIVLFLWMFFLVAELVARQVALVGIEGIGYPRIALLFGLVIMLFFLIRELTVEVFRILKI